MNDLQLTHNISHGKVITRALQLRVAHLWPVWPALLRLSRGPTPGSHTPHHTTLPLEQSRGPTEFDP